MDVCATVKRMKTLPYPTVSLAADSLYRRGTLEFSPKSLFRKDDDHLQDFFTELFRTYRQLLKHCELVSLLFWLDDGTSILQYDGTSEQPVSWAYWQGFAHPVGNPPRQPVLYTDHPIELCVGDIRRIIAAARRACASVLGKPLSFILPFDPGSEFVNSPFRYERHSEILLKNIATGGKIRCIDAIGHFHADTAHYAGYPEGIPEGTPFGEFFGRQVRAWFADVGADALWLSNSFGFGRSPYASGGTGQFFDGDTFLPDGNREVRDCILAFWDLLRKECPELPIYCRGTDFPVGLNLVNHAISYRVLYEGNRYGIVPPPNTPWPALTRNEGLALVGTLTQNAPFPENIQVLRYYTTDQWFCNNPWFDRWNRSPHDLFLNGSLCTFTPDGSPKPFSDVQLGVDGSWGEVVSEIADEVIPLFKRAAAFRPDAAPPLVWVYPFDEYDEMVFGDKPRLDIPYGGDLSILGSLNHAFPLSGAVTTAHLAAACSVQGEAMRECILVTPAPVAGGETERLLLSHLASGGRILCYGTLRDASPAWLAALGLSASAAPLDGEFSVSGDIADAPSNKFFHDAVIGQGGLVETSAGATVLAEATRGGETRALATVHGRAAWTRGGTGATRDGLRGRCVDARNEREWFAPERLYDVALGALGWFVRMKHGLGPDPVEFLISRSRGGFVFTGHSFDDDAALLLRSPWGAPVPLARRVRLSDGAACIPVRGWFHDEVRVFVRQRDGVIGCRAQPVVAKDLHRRWLIEGLEHADVRFFAQPGSPTVYYRTASTEYGDFREPIHPELTADGTGLWFELRDYSGPLSIGW